MKKKTRKIMFNIGLAILMIFSFSIVVLGIAGLIDLKINFGEANLKMTRETANALNSLYEKNNTEYSTCLKIQRKQNYYNNNQNANVSWIITGTEGDYYYAGLDYGKGLDCSLAFIHSHPNHSCVFSKADKEVFKDDIKKGNIFSVVQCGINQFVYIEDDNFIEKYVVIED